MTDLKLVNEWAWMACTKYNEDAISREFYRRKYKEVAKEYWGSIVHQNLMKRYLNGDHSINTYPWPYCDTGFADWPEEDLKDVAYPLSDQSGFIIKDSTSYCAWKLFEATGRWPQKPSDEEFLNAQNWVRYLNEIGYTQVVDPEKLQLFRCYVGVGKKKDLVVWAEFVSDPDEHWATVSSYTDSRYELKAVDTGDFQWVFIQ